jgi:methionyl-tRNA formyltransferase
LLQRLAAQLSPEATALVQPSPAAGAAAPAPGTVLQVVANTGLVVATGGCPLLLREAQLEGKGAASGGPLLQQLQASPGERLG